MCLRCGVERVNFSTEATVAKVFMLVGKLFCYVSCATFAPSWRQQSFSGPSSGFWWVLRQVVECLWWMLICLICFVFIAFARGMMARKITKILHFLIPLVKKPCNWNLFLFLSDSAINHTCFPFRCFWISTWSCDHMLINLHIITIWILHHQPFASSSMIPLPQSEANKGKQGRKKSASST